jgi:hypothetical protein
MKQSRSRLSVANVVRLWRERFMVPLPSRVQRGLVRARPLAQPRTRA